MAITKIHSIKNTVSKAIAYICNDSKTNDSLIYSFNCVPETAALEFDLTAQNARNGGENKAYHLIQSFAPGEVTPEQAHSMARELAERVLKWEYEYVIATHTDKSHLHSHIIFNAVSFKDYKRYKSDKRSYYRIREISDEICESYGIEIIPKDTHKKGTQKRFDYDKHYKKYVSKKSLIQKAVDDAILYSMSYEDFLNEMLKRGYDARNDEYLWFRYKTGKRFTKTNTIGIAYTRENIQKRINGVYRPKNISLLIDIESNIKCSQSKGYEQWAKIFNLKTTAKTLNRMRELGINNYDELKKNLAEHSDKLQSAKAEADKAQKRIDEINKLLKYNDLRRKYLPVIKEYNSKKLLKNSYYEKHKTEIDSYNKAVAFLKSHMTNGKYPNPKSLESEKAKLQSQLDKITKELSSSKADYDEYAALKHNADKILGITENPPQTQKRSLLERLKIDKQRADEYNNQRKASQRDKGHKSKETNEL